MQVIKPLTLGVLFRPYTHRRVHRLVVTVIGFFPLGGETSGFLIENEQWPKVLRALPAGELLDAAMPKIQGEVLLAGAAYAPGGRAVQAMEVGLVVGAVEKRLRVIGDRRWSYGLLPFYSVSEPEPFESMPLTWERAYGGPACADNPSGSGYTGERLGALFGTNEGRMPNVEYPGDPVRSHCGEYAPAGFGPLDLRWRQRRSKAGTYDAQWLENGFPGLADDADLSVFNAAPEDQRLVGFFAGGERYRVEGMHRQAPAVEGRLPAMRVRVLAQRKGTAPHEAEELATVMDTLWLLPEAGLGVALYRGAIDVTDSDALDVSTLMVACERAADPPRPTEWYREVLALRLDPESGLAHALNESQLTPEKTAEESARLRAEDAAAEAAASAAIAGRVKGAVEEFVARSGMAPPADLPARLAEPGLLGAVPEGAIRRGDVDLSPLLARARAVAEKAKAEGEARMAEARAMLERAAAPAPDEEALKREAELKAQLPAAELEVPLPPGLEPAQEQAVQRAREALPKWRHEARRVAPAPLSEAVVPAVSAHLGQRVRQWLAAGVSLAGRDLSGAALAGVDLRGADLRATVFERADLSGAQLAGANLHNAVLSGATLTGADLTGADLREANLSQARLRGARLRQARLAEVMAMEADFSRADLSGADLTRLKAAKACFDGATLDGGDLSDALLLEVSAQGATLRGAILHRAVLYGAKLVRADLSGVCAERCVFTGVSAEESLWRGARLRDVHLGHGSRFSGADLRGMDAAKCGWRGADLNGADLRDVVLAESDLGDCRLDGAKLDRALLARAMLAGASLRGCSALNADFYQAICRKAEFAEGDLRGANLYGATFLEAGLRKTRLDGAFHSRQREVERERG